MPTGGRGSRALLDGFGFLPFGLNGSLANGTAYICPFGFAASQTLEGVFQWTATHPGTLYNLYVQVGTLAVAPAAHTVTLRRNGASTALTVLLNAGAGLSVSDTVNTQDIAPGDLISLQVITVLGAGVSLADMQVGLALRP